MIKQIIGAGLIFTTIASHAIKVAEPPVKEEEWGFRPAAEEIIRTTPAAFVWRTQKNAATYELEYARDPQFKTERQNITALAWNARCPSQVMKPGKWYWHMRFTDQQGNISEWSTTREFTIAADAVKFPLPERQELLSRVPQQHPRIFLRPEQLPELRRLAAKELKPITEAMIKQCDEMLKSPPDTTEPPKYPATMQHGSKEWKSMWWGNRLKVIKVLDGAATLGFCYQLTGNRAYGELAKKILMDCAQWDPVGSTGGLYNDEAGMPYLSRFSRTYSYINDLLSESERRQCRQVITIRGREFYQLLCPKHFYQPYVSHNNRAWHFLGEAGLVFKDEIPEAADWLYFAMTVYYCVYPVWGDDDGGWHEGLWYWSQYLERFFWWGDIMNNTFNISITGKPFFAQTGYYAMYLQPPNTKDGGFGDLSELSRGKHNAAVMRALATLSQNPYWKWYADQLPPTQEESLYIAFMRGAQPDIAAKEPSDLPTSRCFKGNGLVFMNTDLTNGKNNVQLLFKASPRGTASHGYDANNSFILNAYGERLLIHSGTRDNWGSNFHKNWIWDTKSTNCITVNDQSQLKNSFRAKGAITEFITSKDFDYAAGEAAESYDGQLKSFRRQILFCKPATILVIDTLTAEQPAIFTWNMHAINPMKTEGQKNIVINNAGASCRAAFLYPENLNIRQTDQFTPAPPEYLKQRQYHLTATLPEKTDRATYVTLLQPYRSGEPEPAMPQITNTAHGMEISLNGTAAKGKITINTATGEVTVQYGEELFQTAKKK